MGTGLQLFKCSGTLWGQETPNFGDGDGVTTLKMFGDTLGTGKPQTSGFFWGKIPENPQRSRIFFHIFENFDLTFSTK